MVTSECRYFPTFATLIYQMRPSLLLKKIAQLNSIQRDTFPDGYFFLVLLKIQHVVNKIYSYLRIGRSGLSWRDLLNECNYSDLM